MLPTIQLPTVDTGPFLFGARARQPLRPAPRQWRRWLDTLFPAYVTAPPGPHHERYWDWLWAIDLAGDPGAFVAIWARGGAKSTSAELGAAALGLRNRRRYALYICSTQDRADDHVQNIGSLFESRSVEAHYPSHAQRAVGKYGTSKGWRRNRLRSGGAFTVDALGLDVAARGVKLDEMRPDLIILDDIDHEHDSARLTQKKLDTLTKGILPAGSSNAAVIAIQNLITPNGVFARLADGRADFLSQRIVSGPVPAIKGLKTRKERRADDESRFRDVIVEGEPTWGGQGIAECQQLVDRIGLSAFREECQHEVHEREGALWTKAMIHASRVGTTPTLKRIVVGVDPSGGGEEIGIVVVGKGHDNHAYVLEDGTVPGHLGSNYWGSEVVRLYDKWQADAIVAEKNFGGDMVEGTIKAVDRRAPVKLVSASRGKLVRAEPISALYGSAEVQWQDSEVHHVGAFPELETEQTTYVPGDPDSPNRLDALVWAGTELMLEVATRKNLPSSPTVAIVRNR